VPRISCSGPQDVWQQQSEVAGSVHWKRWACLQRLDQINPVINLWRLTVTDMESKTAAVLDGSAARADL